MRFAQPEVMPYLLLVPVIWVLAVVFARVQGRRLKRAFHSKVLPFLAANVSFLKRRLKLALQMCVVALLILSWARPQLGASQQAVKSVGLEMIIAFDVSNSMLSEDVKPSRLEFAKSEIGRLFDQLGGDKVGIVAFAGSAFLLSPMTSDKGALKMFLESLTPDSVTTQGTNIYGALQESEQAFERGGVESDEHTRIAHVILVASDGEDHEQGAIDFAHKVAAQGTRIFSLGFGTEKGAPIPERDDHGYLKGYKKDRGGQVILSTTKGSFLQNLAKAGGGSFYHATFGGNAVGELKRDLDKLEKAEFESTTATQYDEKFQVPLALALLLALLELVLGERRGKGRIWKGRFEVSPQ
jgi:Ca-activated chloride channel family protein